MQSPSLCPILIGRDGEMAVLRDALRAARAGAGQAVLVAGDARIGKTRLVDELATAAEAAGVPVLRGGCAETDLRIPYLPFIEALRGHARRDALARRDGLHALFEAQEGEGGDPTRRRMRIFAGSTRWQRSTRRSMTCAMGASSGAPF